MRDVVPFLKGTTSHVVISAGRNGGMLILDLYLIKKNYLYKN